MADTAFQAVRYYEAPDGTPVRVGVDDSGFPVTVWRNAEPTSVAAVGALSEETIDRIAQRVTDVLEQRTADRDRKADLEQRTADRDRKADLEQRTADRDRKADLERRSALFCAGDLHAFDA